MGKTVGNSRKDSLKSSSLLICCSMYTPETLQKTGRIDESDIIIAIQSGNERTIYRVLGNNREAYHKAFDKYDGTRLVRSYFSNLPSVNDMEEICVKAGGVKISDGKILKDTIQKFPTREMRDGIVNEYVSTVKPEITVEQAPVITVRS